MLEIITAFNGFSVDDIEKAKSFYVEKIGLELDNEKMGLHFNLPGGGTMFIYPKNNHKPATFTVMNFVVKHIDTAVDALISSGVEFERYDNMPFQQDSKGILRGIAAQEGPDIAWFKDPAGNILALLQDS